MSRQQGVILAALLIVALVGVAGWSMNRLMTSKHRAGVVSHETAECIRLADAIEQTRRPQTFAGDEPLEQRQLLELIQHAADEAGIDPNQAIRSIRPQPSRQPAEGMYAEHSAELKLYGVTRKQLAAFMHGLMRHHPGLSVRNIRLSFNEQDEARVDRWNVDALTISYLVYQPHSSNQDRLASHQDR